MMVMWMEELMENATMMVVVMVMTVVVMIYDNHLERFLLGYGNQQDPPLRL